MLPIRDPHHNKRPTQTESEGVEKNIPNKWTGKKSQGSNTRIRQNRLQNKGHKKRYRRTLHNTQGKNPSRPKGRWSTEIEKRILSPSDGLMALWTQQR